MISLVVFERDGIYRKYMMKKLRENDGDFRIREAANIGDMNTETNMMVNDLPEFIDLKN